MMFQPIVEPPKVFVFLYVSEVSFCLDGAHLPFQDTHFTLDVCIVLIKTLGFAPTAAAIRTSIYFKRLSISILFSAFCPDVA